MDRLFDVFDLTFYVVLDLLQGMCRFSSETSCSSLRDRDTLGLILFEEGLDMFSPLMELSFRSLVLLLAAADLLFRPPLVMANGSVGSYVWFNLQKI